MRSIVAAASPAANKVPVVLERQRKLEYRGYDTAGIAALNGAGMKRVRTVGCLCLAHDVSGAPVERPIVISQLSANAVELGQYRHYIQKEIFEQPEGLANTLELTGNWSRLQPGVFGPEAANLFGGIRSDLILAYGTSYHYGITALYWLDSLAGTSYTVEIASEYRYGSSVPDPNQLVVTRVLGIRAQHSGLGAEHRRPPSCPLPRPRPALPNRARRRAQAQANHPHPRRSLRRQRTQARSARPGRPNTPIIAVAPNDNLLDKLKSNLLEVQAHGGEPHVSRTRAANLPRPGRSTCCNCQSITATSPRS